jgi:hypothetical protein
MPLHAFLILYMLPVWALMAMCQPNTNKEDER